MNVISVHIFPDQGSSLDVVNMEIDFDLFVENGADYRVFVVRGFWIVIDKYCVAPEIVLGVDCDFYPRRHHVLYVFFPSPGDDPGSCFFSSANSLSGHGFDFSSFFFLFFPSSPRPLLILPFPLRIPSAFLPHLRHPWLRPETLQTQSLFQLHPHHPPFLLSPFLPPLVLQVDYPVILALL